MMQIDQAGLPAGTPGRARTDGKDDGSLVTLTNTGEGATTLFRLLWRPPGDTDAAESLAPTVDPKVWSFSPTPGAYGTYLVELVENAGLMTERRERRAFVVRTPSLGLVIPALNERGDESGSLADPGALELVDNNAADEPDGSLADFGWAGWWRAFHGLARAVDQSLAPVRAVHYVVGGALTRRRYPNMEIAFGDSFPGSGEVVFDVEPVVAPDPGPHALGAFECRIRSVAGAASVALPALQFQALAHVEQCTLAHPVESTDPLHLWRCRVQNTLAVASLSAVDTEFLAGDVTISDPFSRFDRCELSVNVTATYGGGATITLTNCAFSAASVIEFSGALAGVVRMDPRTAFLFDAVGGSVVNGAITVEAPP